MQDSTPIKLKANIRFIAVIMPAMAAILCHGPAGASVGSRLLTRGSLRMKIASSDFKVAPGKTVDLKKWPTAARPLYRSNGQYRDLLKTDVEALSEQQEMLYASNRYALLVILQAMDAAGKDGAIAHVMSGINPQGCRVSTFKRPSAEELKHDFLWRTTKELPERGQIGIFNRSYYEEVLIVRVHPELLRAQGLPGELVDAKTLWRDR